MKNKLLLLMLILASVFFTFSCAVQYDDTAGDQAEQAKIRATLWEQKREAGKIFAAAHREFFQGVDSLEDSLKSASQVDPQHFGTREKIIAAAWQAYYTAADEELISLLKENGLYDKMQLLIKKYKLDEKQQVLNRKSPAYRKIDISFFDQFVDGDLFLCYGSGDPTIAALIPGHWKHIGMMDKKTAPSSSYCVLSASPRTNIDNGDAVGRVGYESRSKWAGETAVTALRVSGSTSENSRAAINYGRKYIGRPFSFFTSREADDHFYCSKVVWRAWKSQGKDLEHYILEDLKGPWVTPQDIYDHSDTYYIAGDQY